MIPSYSCPFATELLRLVFENVDDDSDLLILASSNRLFNHLALDTLFSRHKTDIRYPFQSLDNFFRLPLKCFEGLLLSIELHRMQWNYLHHYYNDGSQQMMVQDVTTLTRFIERVGQIVHLQLILPFSWNSSELDRANGQLLETICRNTGIRVLDISGHTPALDQSLDTPKQHNRNAKQLNVATPLPSSGTLEDLKLAFIPSCFRRFYSDIFIVNRVSLTCLHLSQMPRNKKKALTALLQKIHLPSLRNLTFSDCHHRNQMPILGFIEKHPHLIQITYDLNTNLGNVEGTPDFPSLLRMIAPHHTRCIHLGKLKVNIPYVHCFISLKSPMLALKSITLCCTYDSYMMGQKVFDEALSVLRHCPDGLHLTLNSVAYEFDLGGWLNNLPVDDPYRPERTLTCIRSISLEQSAKPFDASLLDCLPKWFALFPALEEIEIWTMPAQIPLLSSNPDTIWPSSQPRKIALEVKQACAMVRKLSMVSGMERAQHLWDDGLSRYQYSSSTRNIWRKKPY
ncbi:hypothetical protein BJ165DRAFT_1467332 [Panaeolus papilionaceus]|nr:hypothetical protein BJ165DRAFT_1467332 [Panaeolus papilionaceus]